MQAVRLYLLLSSNQNRFLKKREKEQHMPSFIEGLGQGAATQAADGLVSSVFGLALEGHNDRRQLEQQKKLSEQQLGFDKQWLDYQKLKDLEMWEKTNYSAQVKQLEKAGLNPGLIYGMSGGGGTTTGSGGSSTHAPQAPSGGGEIMGIMSQTLQAQMLKANIDLAESQANKNNVEATKLAGVDTDLTKAQAENTILQQIITKYTGQEQKDVYERIMSPTRGVQAKTYEDELSARQGIAGTIYELWTEGKLKEKGVAEIEQLLLSNAKTREETRQIYKQMELLEENIKNAKLDNIIKELETKLQTETGIDSKSPTWLKVLGRLFVTLFN